MAHSPLEQLSPRITRFPDESPDIRAFLIANNIDENSVNSNPEFKDGAYCCFRGSFSQTTDNSGNTTTKTKVDYIDPILREVLLSLKSV